MLAPCTSSLRRLAIHAAFAMALWAHPALSCQATIVTAPATVQIQYDAFDFTNRQAIASFELSSTSSETCVVDLALVKADHIAADDFTIGDTDVHVKATADTAGGGVIQKGAGLWSVQVSSAARTRVTLRFDVAMGGVVQAGVHPEQLSLELRAADTVSSMNEVPLTIMLASPPRAQMNIAGATGTFGSSGTVSEVDFGVMETGKVRHVFLQIRANTRAMLSIDSQNRGQLKLLDPEQGGDGIPYETELAGETVDLSQHWQREMAPPRTMAGTALPFDLTLGLVGPRRAGRYGDILTIMISGL
ncbi:MAG: hypothetical protein JWL66_2970 [Sphingomonadales bacterium]|nr:hypothetical protein [Sphingomonadales bacterium]